MVATRLGRLCLYVVAVLVASGCDIYGGGNGISTPECADASTSFEFTDTSGSFSISGEDSSITFENGLAQTLFQPPLYNSGSFSWMVPAGQTGTIRIEPPAAQVRLFLRDQFGVNNGVLTLLDGDGNVIDTVDATTSFVEIDAFPASGTTQGVATIELAVGGSTGFGIIDDFSACPVQSVE